MIKQKYFKKLQKRPDPDLYFHVPALDRVYFSVPDPDPFHFGLPDPDPFHEYGSGLQIIMDNLHKKINQNHKNIKLIFFFFNKLLLSAYN